MSPETFSFSVLASISSEALIVAFFVFKVALSVAVTSALTHSTFNGFGVMMRSTLSANSMNCVGT
ncbi:hypothetical protein D3C87_1873930 [compost metagenome]